MQITYDNSEIRDLYASAIRLYTGTVLPDTNYNDESFLARILVELIFTHNFICTDFATKQRNAYQRLKFLPLNFVEVDISYKKTNRVVETMHF